MCVSVWGHRSTPQLCAKPGSSVCVCVSVCVSEDKIAFMCCQVKPCFSKSVRFPHEANIADGAQNKWKSSRPELRARQQVVAIVRTS